jgi:hypothetical protein
VYPGSRYEEHVTVVHSVGTLKKHIFQCRRCLREQIPQQLQSNCSSSAVTSRLITQAILADQCSGQIQANLRWTGGGILFAPLGLARSASILADQCSGQIQANLRWTGGGILFAPLGLARSASILADQCSGQIQANLRWTGGGILFAPLGLARSASIG